MARCLIQKNPGWPTTKGALGLRVLTAVIEEH